MDLHPATDLAALYREQQPGLLRYLRAVAPGTAEDLAADVWVEVAASAHRFQGDEGAFRGWIYTIARRRVIDGHRHSFVTDDLHDRCSARKEDESIPP